MNAMQDSRRAALNIEEAALLPAMPRKRMAGSAALQSALRGLAYGGTIAYAAFAKPFGEGLWLGQEGHFNYGKIVFTRACSEPSPDYPRWNRKRIEDTVWKMLMENYLECDDLLDPVIPFAESAEGFMKYVDQHPELSIKMGVEF